MQLGFSGQLVRVLSAHSGSSSRPSSQAASFFSQRWPSKAFGRGSMLTFAAPTSTSPGWSAWAEAEAAKPVVAARINSRTSVRNMIPSQGGQLLYTDRSGRGGKSDESSEERSAPETP